MILALSTGTRIESVLQLINVLILFCVVLVLTYFGTKWIAKFQGTRQFNRNIEVIETFRVTNNKYIQIVRTGDIYLVIGICKDTMTMLAQLDESQLEEVKSIKEEAKINNFAEIFEKVKEIKPKK